MQGPLQPPASEALGHQQAFLGMLVASHFRGFLHDQWYSVFLWAMLAHLSCHQQRSHSLALSGRACFFLLMIGTEEH